MTTEEILDELRLLLFGAGILESELDDDRLRQIVKISLRELSRYCDEPSYVTVPFRPCIELSNNEHIPELVSSVVHVYRAEGVGENAGGGAGMDPAYAQQWMLFSDGGTTFNLNEYIMNLAAWQTVRQIQNTMSTDMSFVEDTHNKKLYINNYSSAPSRVTIAYIPTTRTVESIQSNYWIDILVRMCLDNAKIVIGRIRTRYTQSNAQWTQDGEKLLEEGNTDLKELREVLRENDNLTNQID